MTDVYDALCKTLSGYADAVPWADFTPTDWESLPTMARAEGVAPLMYWKLKEGGWPASMPDATRTSLAQAYYSTVARNMLLYRELRRVLDVLGESGIPAIALKGAALAATLYPHIGLRPMGDLDLLVPRPLIEKAVQAARSFGYREIHPELAPGINKVVGYHVHLQGGLQAPACVELHWSLMGGDHDWRSPPMGWFWEQTELISSDGGGEQGGIEGSHTLTPTAHLPYLAAHLMLHHGETQARLLWFYDIHLVIHRWGERLNWDELLARSADFRWAAALFAALQGAQLRFHTVLPPGVLDVLTDVRDPHSQRFVERNADPSQTSAARTWNKLTALSWPARLRLALALVFPSPAHLRWRYSVGSGLWPLYYPRRWTELIGDALGIFWRRLRGIRMTNRVPKGLLVTFSGIDGAGKSTQIELLMEHLRQEGRKPLYVWTRGGYTPLFEGLKVLLRRLPGRAVPPSGNNPQRAQVFSRGWVRRLWLVLALLDLLWLYGLQLRWWRWRGRAVVCDRYLWDTLIDFRLNFPHEQVERWWLWRLIVRIAPRPDAAFLLLVPVEESVRRSDVKGEPFREPPEVLAQRLAQYQALAQDGHWHVMDGRRPIPELAGEVLAVVQSPPSIPPKLGEGENCHPQ